MSAADGAFRHVDRDRTIVFGPGALDAAAELVAEPFTLLSTPRAAANPLAAGLVARAAARVDVPSGLVEEVAAGLRGEVTGTHLVALGGGRVADVAKALAAADPPRTLVAVPTTLSGAEMTGMHRHALGVAPGAPFARPGVVLNDPALSASQPPELLAASGSNALGHALVAIASTRTNPLAAAVARDAVARLAAAWGSGAASAAAGGTAGASPAAEPDRPTAALGALLAGWAVDQSGLGLHHVLAQTAVRTAGLGHAQANGALLPVTAAALRRRAPGAFAALDALLGGEPHAVEALARRLRDAAGLHGLGAISADEALLERTVDRAAARTSELARVPPPPDRDELRAIYRAAARP